MLGVAKRSMRQSAWRISAWLGQSPKNKLLFFFHGLNKVLERRLLSAQAKDTAELKLSKRVETTPQLCTIKECFIGVNRQLSNSQISQPSVKVANGRVVAGFETTFQLCARKGQSVHRGLNILRLSYFLKVH